MAKPTPFEGKRAKTLTDDDGNVHLIFNKKGNIFYSRLDPESGEFSKPLRVNSIANCAAIGEIAIGKNGRVHILFHGNIFYVREQIKSEDRKPQGSDIKYTFYARLKEAGDGFEEQRNVSGHVWGFDGGCAIAADEDGNVYLFVGGTTRKGKEQDRRIFMRHSEDNGETFSVPRPVGLGEGVCACCHLKARVSAEGGVMLAYRVAKDGVERNSYVLTSRDHGKTFTHAPLDAWKLRACPGTVYSFARSAGRTIVSWRNRDEVFLKISDEDAIRPPDRTMKRRAPVLGSNAKGDVLMAWAEGENFNKPHHLHWQLYDKAGNRKGAIGMSRNVFERWGSAAIYAEPGGNLVILY